MRPNDIANKANARTALRELVQGGGGQCTCKRSSRCAAAKRPRLPADCEEEAVGALDCPLAWTTQFRAFGWHRVLAAVPLVGPLLAAASNSLHHLRMMLEDAITPQPWIEDNAAMYLVLAQRADDAT